jgi:hypothetical protein
MVVLATSYKAPEQGKDSQCSACVRVCRDSNGEIAREVYLPAVGVLLLR